MLLITFLKKRKSHNVNENKKFTKKKINKKKACSLHVLIKTELKYTKKRKNVQLFRSEILILIVFSSSFNICNSQISIYMLIYLLSLSVFPLIPTRSRKPKNTIINDCDYIFPIAQPNLNHLSSERIQMTPIQLLACRNTKLLHQMQQTTQLMTIYHM